ncbi:hypothetical protein ABZ815_46975 [Nonomuraea sp. NPDC047529]|uniref:hypothetical protein n=1 Tax=Nonomuraea sp. NPDC047529 TaxID=3155623 RepID=UPI0034109EC7
MPAVTSTMVAGSETPIGTRLANVAVTGAFRPVDPQVAATILFTVLHSAADAIATGEQSQRWLVVVHDLTRHWLAPPSREQ